QPRPGPQGPHVAPPQSTSVSSPFFTVSSHAGTWQTMLVHTPLWQSGAATHIRPSLHGPQSGPPQSTSVSLAFCTPSTQVGSAHLFSWQTPLAQSLAATHSTQLLAPSQTFPPPELHAVPSARGVFLGDPASQVSSVQSFESSRTSASSFSLVELPLPSH